MESGWWCVLGAHAVAGLTVAGRKEPESVTAVRTDRKLETGSGRERRIIGGL